MVLTEISDYIDEQFMEAFKRSRKLKNFYKKQIERGWSEEAALEMTYDEWFYNEY